MKILGIETSCDETGVCFLEAEGEFGPDFRCNIRGNALATQAAKHAEYGGVFPNLAKREHQKNLVPMLTVALKEAGELKEVREQSIPEKELLELLAQNTDLATFLIPFLKTHVKPDIDAIAVTYGPGLEPALWVGVNFARALSICWNVPVVAVNHMEGHIIVSLMRNESRNEMQAHEVAFPAIALLISGAHTELILMKQFGSYEYLGRTRDDAVGEAFDKVARMLGLPYPGGPHISRLAEQSRCDEVGPHRISLPRPMIDSPNFDFSFAGLKTAVLRITEKENPLSEELKMEIAREFEDAAADVLVSKTLRAAEVHGVHSVIVGGGVSANTHIKAELKNKLEKVGVALFVSPPELSTDNAVMIALAGYFHARRKEFANVASLEANGSLKLSS